MRLRNLSLAAAAALITSTAHGQSAAPIVSVEEGRLSGIAGRHATAFLGIPYAAPPTGANRWRSPRRPTAWSGVRPAREFGASCVQQPVPPFGPYTEEFLTVGRTDEDCLTLNIWKPAAAPGKRPVLVWIHGGGFTLGSGSVPIYDGAALAARGVVVVTINYRLGVFGYLAHPLLSAESKRGSSGNYGLEDQLAALRWVNRNIARFGGDPRNITVAGESAGAISVNSLTLSPDAQGLFKRAAAYSGSGMGFRAPSLAEAEQRGVAVAADLGVRSLSELRALPAARVLAAGQSLAGKTRFAFWPVVDGQILPVDPEAIDGRHVPAVPLMTGFNADENFFAAAKTPADFERIAGEWFGSAGTSMARLYPHATDAQAQDSIRLLARDRYMAQLVLWTNTKAKARRSRIYRYLYDQPSPVRSGTSYGAFHTAGIPYLFGNLDRAKRPYGPGDDAVARQLQDRLLDFMRRGDPNGGALPHWSPVSGDDDRVMTIGLKPGWRSGVSSPERLKALLDFAAAGGNLSLF